ncbi:MAG: tetratricopeptide repeat protein, partial [Planctomycetes bacterium]|nr:tetratricopeptide repeat protein [Planctomycetota bacterium]
DILHVEPPAPRKIRPEIPADLETIVMKSIAREPGHRYQSAGELADDLGRFLDGLPILARRSSSILRLWRWARRNRAVASLSGLALLLLVLVAVVASVGYFQTRRARDQESEQRQRAEAATAVAQEAFDEIFDRFAPSRIHAAVQWTIEDAEGEEIPVRVQPVLSKEAALLLEQTLRFYQQLAQQEGSDARLRRKIAEASRRVGDIHQRLGDVDAARQAYERALDLYAKLEGEESGAAEISVEIARIHNELGNLSWAEEEPGFPSHLQALSILRSAGADLARSAEHRYELARTYYFLARSPVPAGFDAGPLFLEGQRPGPDGRGGKRGPGGPPRGEDRGGDRAGDRPSGPEGGPWGEPPFDRPGDGGTDRLGGDGGVDRPGGAEPPGGEPAGGRRETPRDGVFPAGGPPPEWRHRGPRSRGERPEGMPRWRPQEQLEEAIAILGELAAEFPSQPEYRRLLALCHRERSRAPLPFDARRRAEDMERSLEILRSLVEEHPDVAEYRHDLAETCALTQIPTIFFRPWGQPALSEEERLEIYRGAKAQLEEAVAIAEALVTDHPNVPDYANSLVRFRRDLAETLLGLGDVEAARREIESARSRQELLVKRFPEVVSYRLWRAMLEESRARVLELSGDPDGALAALAASAADLKRLLEENPGLKQAGGVLFATMRTTAAVLKRQGREEEARELFRGGGPPRPPGEGPPERSGPTQQP